MKVVLEYDVSDGNTISTFVRWSPIRNADIIVEHLNVRF